jgi:DNA polymerase-3 subunit delta'
VKIFDHIIGQDQAVAQVGKAIEAARQGNDHGAMSHAWLITGGTPSSRTDFVNAFAAALVCPTNGCGVCRECETALKGTHLDVEHLVPEGVSVKTDEVTKFAKRTSLAALHSSWHVFIAEEIDRFKEDSASKILKTLEEPPPGTVWILTAPFRQDVFDTIQSRCRVVNLASLTQEQIAQSLIAKHSIDSALAHFAGRVSQGDMPRALEIATNEETRRFRSEILKMPTQVKDVSQVIQAAALIMQTVKQKTELEVALFTQQATQQINRLFGDPEEGKLDAKTMQLRKRALKDIENRTTRRERRATNDLLAGVLIDLTSFYRDVLVIQSGATTGLINEELRAQIESFAARSDVTQTLVRIDAIDVTRDHLYANVTPLLAFEALLVRLMKPLG